MKRLLGLSALALACRVYPAPDATHQYACAQATDCTSQPNGACVNGFCVYGGDAGSDAGPTCGASGGSGCACDAGQSCFRGACFPGCPDGGGCGAGTSCDLAALICVPTAGCSPSCPGDQACVAQVCVEPPLLTSAATCGDAGEGAGDDLHVTGSVLLFSSSTSSILATASSVTFFQYTAGGAVENITPATVGADGGSYSVTLPTGDWYAYVQGPGMLTTFFPGLLIASNGTKETTLDLNGAVSQATLEALCFVPTPGRWVWVGTVEHCTNNTSGWEGGYTVGLSPQPYALAYCTASAGIACVDPKVDAGKSDPLVGTFIALDVPLGNITNAVAVYGRNGTGIDALLSGAVPEVTFASQVDGADDAGLALALLYPNWSQ